MGMPWAFISAIWLEAVTETATVTFVSCAKAATAVSTTAIARRIVFIGSLVLGDEFSATRIAGEEQLDAGRRLRPDVKAGERRAAGRHADGIIGVRERPVELPGEAGGRRQREVGLLHLGQGHGHALLADKVAIAVKPDITA